MAAKKNAVVMTVESDEKTFWLPEDRDYRVVLTGNDNGKMDYTISVIDSDSELTTARKNYFGCEVKKGVSMTMAAVPKKAISTYDLKAENGTVIPAAEVFENNAIRNFTVSTHFEGSDLPDAKYSVESGSYVDVLAPKINESVFNGWYVNSKLISTSTEYRFRPTADVTLTAKYMAGIAVVPGDVSGDGEVTAEDELALDRYEGVPRFYYKAEMQLPITGIRSGKVRMRRVFVYIMHEDRAFGIPSRYYVDVCLQGYRAFGFDQKKLMSALRFSAEEARI